MQRLTFCFLILFLSVRVFCQTNLLDPTFGIGGRVIVSIGGFGQRVDDMLILPNGKILVAGGCRQPMFGGYSVFLTRISEDGTIDTTFGSGGLSPFIYEEDSQVLYVKVAVQNDGKIILMVNYNSSITNLRKATLYRFHPNGTPDTSFGVNGKASSHFGISFLSVNIDIDSDNRIVLGGNSYGIAFSQLAVIRFLPNGAKDNSFNGNGKLVINLSSLDEHLQDFTLLPDGKILAACEMNNNQDSTYLTIVSINPDGSLDSSYAVNGQSIPSFGDTFRSTNKIKYYPNGKVRLTGIGEVGVDTFQYCTFQLTSEGNPDPDFGNNGVIFYNKRVGSSGLYDSYFHENSKTFLGGGGIECIMMRINEDGNLDQSFYENGILSGSNYAVFDSIRFFAALAKTPDGKLLAAGYHQGTTQTALGHKFAIFRFLSDSTTSVSNLQEPVIKLFPYPNPVTTSLTIDYTLQSSTPVTINLFDQTGRKVQTLLTSSQRSAGNHSEQFNLQNLPSGIYSLELSSGKYSRTVQLVKK